MSIESLSPRPRPLQIRSFLERHGLGAWLAWRPDELVMLSGYYPYWGASFLLCLADADPVLFVPQIEPRDHIPPGLRVHEYPWGDLKCADPYTVFVSALSDELRKARVEEQKFGVSAGASRSSLPIQAAEQIPIPEDFAGRLSALARNPEAHSQADFASLYLRKSAEELQAIRLANRVANVGLQVFAAHLQAGAAEAEVASAVESAIYRQIGHDGIFHSRGWATVQSGPNSADAGRFNRSTGRRFENGDLVLIELATCVNGYWSDLTRTAPVGSANPEGEEILSIVNHAQQAALDGVRAGVSGGEVDALAREVIAAHGLSSYFTHHTGHHVGFRYHDPGFGLVPGESARLEAGMVITVEPGVYVPARRAGARIEDNVLVTESGYESLSGTGGAPPHDQH